MLTKFLFFFVALFLVNTKISCAVNFETRSDSAIITDSQPEKYFNQNEFSLKQQNALKLISKLQNATVENKKITAAVLTLTLGMLGVHRIYLGTAPYIPAVYLFTFGGGFFILPIIDLVMILSTKDIGKFENNNKLLMWTGE